MTALNRPFAAALMVTCVTFSVAVSAQKKAAKTSSYTPLTAMFRCPLEADCLATDGIQGDTAGPYVGTSIGDQGPTLNSGGDLYFPLKSGLGRFITVDFSAPLGTPACAANLTCRKNFESVYTDSSQPASITNALAADGTALPDGFRSIAVGQSVRARYKLNFDDPSGRALRWTVRFNSAVYPGSTDVTVTRVDTNTWIVEATDADVAELVSTPTSGRAVTISEGFYTMPFRITVVR